MLGVRLSFGVTFSTNLGSYYHLFARAVSRLGDSGNDTDGVANVVSQPSRGKTRRKEKVRDVSLSQSLAVCSDSNVLVADLPEQLRSNRFP